MFSFPFLRSPPPVFARRALLWLAGAASLVAWAALAWRSHTGGAPPLGWMLATLAVAWVALIGALRCVGPGDARVMLMFALGFRLVAFLGLPVMEDDHYRFLWDGYRFAATGDPYARAPQEHFSDEAIPAPFRAVLDRINHPDVPTVYGPLAQWAFRLCYVIAPAQLWPWKLLLLGAELAILALLWPGLGARGRLLLAWCPLAVFETGFNVHPDVLAILLVVTAWWLGRRRLALAAGAAVGLAVAAKIFAVLLVPFLLWRVARRAWIATAAVLVGLYLPFWARGSAADLAGLRAMAGEWEFNSSVFALVTMVASRATAQTVCAITFAAVWCGLLWRWTQRPARLRALPPGEWVFGALLLLSATANPWYALWLWPFVAARPSVVGVVALTAVSLAYVTGLNLGHPTLGNFEHPGWLRPVEFGLIAAAALWTWWKKKRPTAQGDRALGENEN